MGIEQQIDNLEARLQQLCKQTPRDEVEYQRVQRRLDKLYSKLQGQPMTLPAPCTMFQPIASYAWNYGLCLYLCIRIRNLLTVVAASV
jgi:hypothetical protein